MRSVLPIFVILFFALAASAQQLELELAFEESPKDAPLPAEETIPEPATGTMDERVPESAAEPVAESSPEMPLPVSTGPTPQRFSPSEEVRADFSVSFPTDI